MTTPPHLEDDMTEQATRTHTPDRITVDEHGRKTTTIKMKRACNGCGRRLGDVTEQEMARGINGLPLPDVRRECPDCAPTAPEPRCIPTAILVGEPECLDVECGHEHSAEGGPDPIEDSYCDEVTEQAVCITHSEIGSDGAITRAEPWPCKHTPAPRPAVPSAAADQTGQTR